jgi:predicted Zn finger-like uncharacterized protein
MILTCPECATSYFADDAAIGAGRLVRCGACGASWRAQFDTPLDLEFEPSEPSEPFAPALAKPEADLRERPPSELSGEQLQKAFRAKAEQVRKMREAAAQGAVWAGIGAAFVLVLASAVVFRLDVVRLWPRSASAYAAVGLPVNAVGLTIEDAHALPSLQDGHPALLVSGVLRNVRPKTVLAPPLSIVLRDKDNQPLLTRVISPGDPSIPPGQTRSFAVSLIDPPAGAANVDIDFVLGRKPVKATPAPIPATLPKLRPETSELQAMEANLPSVQDPRPLDAVAASPAR